MTTSDPRTKRTRQIKRWAALDFGPREESTGCPQCGSKIRSFKGQQCYQAPHEWHDENNAHYLQKKR